MEDIEDYVKGWKDRLAGRKIERRKKYRTDFSLARECAQMLFFDFNVESVYLVGSLAGTGKYRLNSDIDLLVAGLAPEKYFKALSVCSRQLSPGQTMDLILVKDLNEEERKYLLGQGVSLVA